MMQKFKPYIKIARLDHWIKQVFVLPGILLGLLLTNSSVTNIILPAIIGLISTSLIASANYTINEWLDREFDKFHPKKKNRPSVNKLIKGKYVYIQYFLLSFVGLILGICISWYFFLTLITLLIMGLIYNAKPLRTKDLVFLDVLSESINNPIRLLLGWFIVDSTFLPPSTLILSYFFSGAFLMAAKRYTEYNFINDPKVAALYRKSFERYTKESLLTSIFFYGICSSFFLAVFMIKYKIELILTFPFFSALFAWYMHFALKPDSAKIHAEGLFTEKKFMIYFIFLILLVIILLFAEIPILKLLTESTLLI